MEKAEAQRPVLTTHKTFYTAHTEITFCKVQDISPRDAHEPALTALPISEQWSCRRYSMSTSKSSALLCSVWISWWIVCSACSFNNKCTQGQFLWESSIHHKFTLQLVLQPLICMSTSKKSPLSRRDCFSKELGIFKMQKAAEVHTRWFSKQISAMGSSSHWNSQHKKKHCNCVEKCYRHKEWASEEWLLQCFIPNYLLLTALVKLVDLFPFLDWFLSTFL